MKTQFVFPSLLIVSFFYTAQACAPVFPDAYLPYGLEVRVLDMPEASFYHELSVMLGQTQKLDKWWSPGTHESWINTIAADVQDLKESLSGVEDADEIVAAYSSMRRVIDAVATLPQVNPEGMNYDRKFPGVDTQSGDASGTSFDLSKYDDLLARIPNEFALYVRGAAAYRGHDLDTARTHWRALLDLPESDRTYRSTWASYMIGKSLMHDNPEEAIAEFEQTRTLAESGYKDSLALAPDSFGWQAMAETSLGRSVDAVRHYAAMFLNGPENVRVVGYQSLRTICARSLTLSEERTQLAEDPLCRRIMTAWLVANRRDTESKAWLDTVAAVADKETIEGGDRLAWLAYDNGDMEASDRWLERADPASPYTRWVRAKLLLREGNIDEALALLRDVSKSFPPEEQWINGYHEPATVVPRDIASAELGVLLLRRQDYINALDNLMRSGYWMDAAYVAERVLTIEELEGFVAGHSADPELAKEVYESQYWDYGGTTRIQLLQRLLARRLARANRWDDALALYSDTERSLAETVSRNLAIARAPMPEKGIGESVSDFFSGIWGSKPRRTIDRPRAEALYDAAVILRRNGMQLIGTETDPDWAVFQGDYEAESVAGWGEYDSPSSDDVLVPALVAALTATDDELRRVSSHAPEPYIRFHYRFVASGLMWQAAEMLPDNDPKCASALYWGGVYIKGWDPDGADKFYKALVWRNLNLPYAQAADKKRWFPKDPPM